MRYLQLVHNVWDPSSASARTKVLYSFGRAEDLDRAAIERLITSLSKLLDPATAHHGRERRHDGREQKVLACKGENEGPARTFEDTKGSPPRLPWDAGYVAQSVSQRQRDEIADAVRNIVVGQIHVQQVTLEDREEPTQRYLSVEVMLSDPTAETWPADEFFELRKEVRNVVVRHLGADTDLQLTYVPTQEASEYTPEERDEPGGKAQSKAMLRSELASSGPEDAQAG